ncbi:MAG: hypothetical protein IJ730_04095 [Alphaproteobacteria bacterium]|nr:hypothetical protein [Alphaproteobacteria bacterium]
MAIVTISGRAGIVRSLKNSSIFLAWGQGDESWTGDEKFSEDPTQTKLIREVGRRIVDEVQFVVGDDQGAIVTQSGRWNISETPTNNLYISARYDAADGNGFKIREFGVFLNTVVKEGLPAGQRYFLPTDIEDPGELLMLENSVPIIRTGDTRYRCSFVMSL